MLLIHHINMVNNYIPTLRQIESKLSRVVFGVVVY